MSIFGKTIDRAAGKIKKEGSRLTSRAKKESKRIVGQVRENRIPLSVENEAGKAVVDLSAPGEIPESPTVTPMPLPDDELSRSARRRSKGKRRGGRSSSILTGGGDSLG